MDESKMVKILKAKAKELGGVRPLARVCNVTPSYVCDILNGRRAPGPSILKPLGYKRIKVVSYEPVKGGAS